MVQLFGIWFMAASNSLITAKMSGKVLSRLQSKFILCNWLFVNTCEISASYIYLGQK